MNLQQILAGGSRSPVRIVTADPSVTNNRGRLLITDDAVMAPARGYIPADEPLPLDIPDLEPDSPDTRLQIGPFDV